MLPPKPVTKDRNRELLGAGEFGMAMLRPMAATAGTADIPVAFLLRPDTIETSDSGYRSLATAGDVQSAPAAAQTPAVPIKKSIFPDYIVCLEDGKKLKMLKRHLQTSYGLTPDAYRAKWGLPRDYPMVAPNYAATRSGLAKKLGLGRKPAPETEPAVTKLPARRARGTKA